MLFCSFALFPFFPFSLFFFSFCLFFSFFFFFFKVEKRLWCTRKSGLGLSHFFSLFLLISFSPFSRSPVFPCSRSPFSVLPTLFSVLPFRSPVLRPPFSGLRSPFSRSPVLPFSRSPFSVLLFSCSPDLGFGAERARLVVQVKKLHIRLRHRTCKIVVQVERLRCTRLRRRTCKTIRSIKKASHPALAQNVHDYSFK